MNNQLKEENRAKALNLEKGRSPSARSKLRSFALAAVASLSLSGAAGCSYETINNYYYGPTADAGSVDAGTKPGEDSGPAQDAGPSDAGPTCTPPSGDAGTAVSCVPTPPTASLTLVDNDSGDSYTEHQVLTATGGNQYELTFDGPGSKTVGIPVCTKASEGDYTGCKLPVPPSGVVIDDATETHRVQVGFLGGLWIISEMNAPVLTPGSGPTAENTMVSGGGVKLAKESVSGILNVGESFQVDCLKIRLDDLEAHGDVASAIISILDANGNILKKDKVAPGETKDYNINGKSYPVHVYKVAPGYTYGAKWADMAIYSQELDLRDGQTVQSGSSSYNVSLQWQNLNAAPVAGSVPQGSDPTAPDALRSITIVSNVGEICL